MTMVPFAGAGEPYEDLPAPEAWFQAGPWPLAPTTTRRPSPFSRQLVRSSSATACGWPAIPSTRLCGGPTAPGSCRPTARPRPAARPRMGWIVDETPWLLEARVIANLDVPLNVDGNQHNRFHTELVATRAQAVARARTLPHRPKPRRW